MRIRVTMLAGFMVLASACDRSNPSLVGKTFSIDKTVDQASADRLGALLLLKVPAIQAELATRRQADPAVELIVRVEHGPEPEYTGADKTYHRNYYWMYVGFHGKAGILKHSRYLIHQDADAAGNREILVYDDAKDEFVPLA